jgi:carbon-monoxide dehydrogenase medium subunit
MLHPFGYAAPATKKELLALLAKHKERAKLLAGGTDLLVGIRAGSLKPEIVVDLKKLPGIATISFSSKEGLSIGAGVLAGTLVADETVRSRFPLLADAASRLGSPQLRNRATVGGNLCTASPCADLGVALMALGASVEIVSEKGERVIPLSRFFTGVKKTVLGPTEYLSRIVVPADMAGAWSGMEKLKRIKGHDIALASVALVRTRNVMRVAVGSCAPTPVVTKDLPPGCSLSETQNAVRAILAPIDDLRASADYRVAMVEAYVERIFGRME